MSSSYTFEMNNICICIDSVFLSEVEGDDLNMVIRLYFVEKPCYFFKLSVCVSCLKGHCTNLKSTAWKMFNILRRKPPSQFGM